MKLTVLRRDARTRRSDILRDVFQAGRGLGTVVRALMARRRLDEEELLPWRLELATHREEADSIRAWASDWMLEEARVEEEQ